MYEIASSALISLDDFLAGCKADYNELPEDVKNELEVGKLPYVLTGDTTRDRFASSKHTMTCTK